MKKKLKLRVNSILMAVLMVASIIPMGAISSFALISGDYEYSIVLGTDKTAKITKYNGAGGDITIPSTIDGYKVTEIGKKSFENCAGLTNAKIPDTVTSIGEYAFSGTPFYNSLPNGEVYFGKVFYKYKGTMPKDTGINIKDGTVSISDCAFQSCTGLISVTIPNTVISIGVSAFSICTGLTSIKIPDSVTSIGKSAFRGCTNLTSVAMGNNITSISDSIFENCTALTGIIIPNSVTSIGDSAFLNTALTSIIIPNRVTHIGLWAFFGCKDLKSITIPDSVTYIGRLAFRDCHLDLVIKAPAGSVAETYAKDNNIKFESNTAPTKRALGDVTGDGKVTSGDAIAVLRAEAQLKKLTAVEFTAADVVKDGRVTSGDAIRILRYEAQLIPSL